MSGEVGQIVDLEITDAAHGGVVVGRLDGRVVFTGDAIPGERVRARLTDVSKTSFWRAETLEVTDASPHRQRHIWPEADIDRDPADRPGGAEFGHIELAHQRDLKCHILATALQRTGGLDIPVEFEGPRAASVGNHIVTEQPDGTRWRTRVSLHVDDDGRVGAFAARSHRVIQTENLPLATAAIERAAATLGRPAPGRIDLVQPADGHVRVLPHPGRAEGGRRGSAPRRSADVIVEHVGSRRFRVDAGGFWQVHRLAASTLTAVVAEELADGIDPDGWHLDLYGGVGLFGAVLGELAGPSARITSVEGNDRATEHAGENLAEWVGARAETARVDRWTRALRQTISERDRERLARGTVVLDPPRTGAGAAVVDDLAALAPASIVYVACDPVALARDLARFAGHGYRADHVRGIDLFPHSHHMEAVALLRRDAAR
ncbi:class I SAM-dependent RNA methyltransferase [Microbacterium schleiferi]|uniref:Class I SAM-dependent RNA methyltransferase n=1 Tax=Microbacterium schleiferi TaxID=69362 RepID=A0A7S8MZ28_9MICO|nr:class I SAM-dependent RNA methyltransferase [Microbacterium schleiferi]QPE05185.1 class I SAM-dependent RNA methyltransferase [Microbacterium schleiferi]